MEITSNTATSTADGFSVEERTAMKGRVADLRAERTNGARRHTGCRLTHEQKRR